MKISARAQRVDPFYVMEVAKAAGVRLTDEVWQELQAMIAAAGITGPAKREG